MPKTQSKCAHLPCICVPPDGEKYCTQFCKDAGSEETEIASASRHYILHPFAVPSVGERNQESLRRSKNIHWRPVDPA